MLAPVLILLGLVVVFRTLPASWKARLTAVPTLLAAIAVLVAGGLLTVVVRGAAGTTSSTHRNVAVDARGVCAEESVHPRCSALLAAAAAVLDALDAEPAITIPGSGRLVLRATSLHSQPPQSTETAVHDAFRAGGWTPISSRGGLATFERAGYTAAVSVSPSGGQTLVTISVSE